MIDINTYINNTETTFIRLRVMLYFRCSEEVTRSHYLQEMEYLPYIMENIDEAVNTIDQMLISSSFRRQERAKKFIAAIRDNCKLAQYDPDPEHRLLYFFNRWQEFYEVIPDQAIPPLPKPILKRVINDGNKLFDIRNNIDNVEIDRLWSAVEGKFISGDKFDFIALCRGTEPKGMLENLAKNRRTHKTSHSAMIDTMLNLGYTAGKQIEEALKKYFGYDSKNAREAQNPRKCKPLANVNRKNKTYQDRDEIDRIFFPQK